MCNTTCGFIAAAVAAIFHGSFVCPMKGEAANSVDVDPLVFQTYKTVMFFVVSWFVLFTGDKFVFTPWAILSALLWIPGGTAGIFSVRTIGVAASVGTWAGAAVLVSGLFGFMLFDEGLKSRFLAMIALFMMIVGLIGMSYASAPSSTTDGGNSSIVSSSSYDDNNNDDEEGSGYKLLADETTDEESTVEIIEHHNLSLSLVADGAIIIHDLKLDNKILICGVKVPTKLLGFCCAVFNGCCTGTVCLPMHYSKEKGLSFLISFAIGALIVLLCAWSLRLAFETRKSGSISIAYAALPSFHLHVMWFAGSLSGTLWTIGTIGGILAVDSLGLGVGTGISQSALIVSGLWGIFYFREVKGKVNIFGWFVSAVCNLSGVFLLASQHTD